MGHLRMFKCVQLVKSDYGLSDEEREILEKLERRRLQKESLVRMEEAVAKWDESEQPEGISSEPGDSETPIELPLSTEQAEEVEVERLVIAWSQLWACVSAPDTCALDEYM